MRASKVYHVDIAYKRRDGMADMDRLSILAYASATAIRQAMRMSAKSYPAKVYEIVRIEAKHG